MEGSTVITAAQASPLNSSIDSASIKNDAAAAAATTTATPAAAAATAKTNNNSKGSRPNGPGQSDDDSGCALEEYTWEPPGLKPDQVRRI